jgi:pimeloyl-ACP methyl ester carboxylesterase
MAALADVVRALLDELRLERVDVLGYSWGGALAQELARRAPDRVRRARPLRDGPRPRREPTAAARPAAGHAGALLPPAPARADRCRASPARARRVIPPSSPSTPASGCSGHRTRSATSTSSTRRQDGRDCHGSGGCRSRRSSSRASAPPACRSATPACSLIACPTLACHGQGRRAPVHARRARERRPHDSGVPGRRVTGSQRTGANFTAETRCTPRRRAR